MKARDDVAYTAPVVISPTAPNIPGRRETAVTPLESRFTSGLLAQTSVISLFALLISRGNSRPGDYIGSLDSFECGHTTRSSPSRGNISAESRHLPARVILRGKSTPFERDRDSMKGRFSQTSRNNGESNNGSRICTSFNALAMADPDRSLQGIKVTHFNTSRAATRGNNADGYDFSRRWGVEESTCPFRRPFRAFQRNPRLLARRPLTSARPFLPPTDAVWSNF